MDKNTENKDRKNISSEFTKELQKEWESKGFGYEECKEWIDAGLKVNEYEFANYLKQRGYRGNNPYIEEVARQLKEHYIEKKVREKAIKKAKRWGKSWTLWKTRGESGLNKIKYFFHIQDLWFNQNCFLATIIENVGRSKIWRLGLWIYEEVSEATDKNVHFIKIFTGSYFSSDEIEEKVNLIKKRLQGGSEEKYISHPVLALLEINGVKPIYFSDIVKKANLVKENILSNPDDYIKKYDIIAIKINNTPSYHVAIYLGNKQITHIPDDRGSPAKPDTLNKFIEGRNTNEVISNRLIIPFKRPELIQEHIERAIDARYGEGQYSALLRNCEHFATLCVTGIKFSSQAENLFNLNFKLDRGKINENTLSNNNFIAQIQVRTTN